MRKEREMKNINLISLKTHFSSVMKKRKELHLICLAPYQFKKNVEMKLGLRFLNKN